MKDLELIALPDDTLIDLSYKGYLFLERITKEEAIKYIGLAQSGHPSYHLIAHVHGSIKLPEADEKEPAFNSIIFLKKCFKK